MPFILEDLRPGGSTQTVISNDELADRLEALARAIRSGLSEVEGSVIVTQPTVEGAIRFMGQQRYASDGWLRF